MYRNIHGYHKTSRPTVREERAGSSIEPDIEDSTHVKRGKTNKKKQERENASSIRCCKETPMTRIMALIAAAGTSPPIAGDRRRKLQMASNPGLGDAC